MSARTTLVLGGTGKTGGRVVERLRSRGVVVRVGSRLGEPRFDREEVDCRDGLRTLRARRHALTLLPVNPDDRGRRAPSQSGGVTKVTAR